MKKISVLYFLLINLLVLISCQNQDFQQSRFLLGEGAEIGSKGPLTLEFSNPGKLDDIEKKISIEPQVDLRYSWFGQKLCIFPQRAFEPLKNYSLFYKNISSKLDNDLPHSDFHWTFKVHDECLVYINDATSKPEIIRSCKNENSKKQITHSDGKIYDFSVSYDGNWVVFSVENDLGGTDISIVDRDGKITRSLLSCGKDVCAEPVFIPDGSMVTYVEVSGSASELDQSSGIWQISLDGKNNSPISILQGLRATSLTWSSDDIHLAFFDQDSSEIRIWNRKNGQSKSFPADEGLLGGWTANGENLLFGSRVEWGGIPYIKIQIWDTKTQRVKEIVSQEMMENEYYQPQRQPQGDWIIAAVRPIFGSATKQLFLIDTKGFMKIPVTTDQPYTHSAFTWNPAGNEIAYQRYDLSKPGSKPEILVWNLMSHSTVILAQNAVKPVWMP